MTRFAANLTLLFQELPFLERFGAARQAGFTAVEYMFPYPYSPEELRDQLRQHGLTQVLFNLPAGDWAAGERGIAVLQGRQEEFRDGVARALTYVEALRGAQPPLVNCLVGKLPEGANADEARRVLVENLRYAASELARAHVTLLIEPINPHDIPGFFLRTPDQAAGLIAEVGADNLRIQYDLYHQQRTEGQLLDTFRRLQGQIAHVQLADVPGRHQPGTGEINYPFVLAALDREGYGGYVGLEYIPEGDTVGSLAWMAALREGVTA
ncbi:hydroxypyruvate isomerase (plasmid) [Deinococcus aetherius]|uniref:Hydroxypyruvate isomerase n=1 Tax=Deinococcus aetherius TaxID=200252 RepID=A0ABN6RNJ8_9DEIO|nr:hydroxypyruvate isomerase [Deinococcus aetherius]BDP44403.1 hydroxypyruvate isomerase [Deinococcus aetherius]